MAPYLGGSAPAMAAQVAEGYALVTAVQLKRLTDAELAQLKAELERTLRDLRGTLVSTDDAPAFQARNRKLGRINGTLQQIQLALTRRHRGT